MEHERPVTTDSAQLFPPPSPGEVAEARKVSDDSDSSTIAGLQRLLLLSAQKNQELGQRYVEDCRSTWRDVLTLVQTTGTSLRELNANALLMQRDHAGYMDMARKPIQPRPTVAETAGHTVEHIVTELRKGLKIAFAKDPELQDKAQKALDGVVEKGKAMLEEATGAEPVPTVARPQAAAPQPSTPPGPLPAVEPAPKAAPPPQVTHQDVMSWMEAVGHEYCVRLFARFGIREPEDITGPAILALRDAYLLLGK